MIEEAKKIVHLEALERRRLYLLEKLGEGQWGRNPKHPLAEYEALCWVINVVGDE